MTLKETQHETSAQQSAQQISFNQTGFEMFALSVRIDPKFLY